MWLQSCPSASLSLVSSPVPCKRDAQGAWGLVPDLNVWQPQEPVPWRVHSLSSVPAAQAPPSWEDGISARQFPSLPEGLLSAQTCAPLRTTGHLGTCRRGPHLREPHLLTFLLSWRNRDSIAHITQGESEPGKVI